MPMKMHESQPNANIPIAVFRIRGIVIKAHCGEITSTGATSASDRSGMGMLGVRNLLPEH